MNGRSFLRAAVGCPVLLLLTGLLPQAQGQTLRTLTDDVIQPNTVVRLGAGESGAITSAGNPFSFPDASSLLDIQSIAITLTLIDADTGTGSADFFRDTLTLRLDGIETGLLLNGFSSAADEGNLMASDYIRLRIDSGGSPSNAAALLAALQTDGQFVATLFESTGASMVNSIGLPNKDFGSSVISVTAVLEITGTVVPEPGVWALLLVGVPLITLNLVRRSRRAA